MKPSLAQDHDAQPLWLDAGEVPLLAWFHPAAMPQRSCGVVLCAPFGHEYLVAYRAYRKLAEALAVAGFPAIFFDFDGSGDSADSEAPRLKAWQENLLQATQQLKQRTGVHHIALFGVRLGALLAAAFAADHPLAALALVAPVVSGRGYARELVAFARLSPIPPSTDPARAVHDDEIAGYPISKDTQAALSKLNLLKMALPPGTHVFISTTDDVTGREDKLIEALQHQGLEVTVSVNGGYAAMMTADAYQSKVPHALWTEWVAWLVQRFPVPTTPIAPTLPDMGARTSQPTTVIADHGHPVRETLVTFDGLRGVVTEPLQRSDFTVGIVLNNTGAGHRVGNHRLNVQLARTLAANGFCVLRFDRAGMGYSRPTPEGHENEVYAEAGVADMRQALNFLAHARGCQTFELAGLCSGAYFAYRCAVVDSRVSGLIMINPLTFNWQEGDSLEVRISKTYKSSGFYLRNAFKAQTWGRLLRGDIAFHRIAAKLLQRVLGRLHQSLAAGLGRLGISGKPEPSVASNFLQMARRGVGFMFVFGADDAALDVVSAELGHHAQLLRNSAQLRVEVVDNTDHTFTPRWSQQLLLNSISSYLLERYSMSAEP